QRRHRAAVKVAALTGQLADATERAEKAEAEAAKWRAKFDEVHGQFEAAQLEIAELLRMGLHMQEDFQKATMEIEQLESDLKEARAKA
ncbi:hypothetical protein NL529_29860, partial [Klebsiella pneumoniae]|nr:hypothetical protein [Klebsiella pneumoniae]